MIQYESYPDHQNCYEYHGNTSVEITRKQDGVTTKRDWILFDSVEEAQNFFYSIGSIQEESLLRVELTCFDTG